MPIVSDAPPTQIIEECSTAFLEGIVERNTATVGTAVFTVSVVFPVFVATDIPDSFIAGMADCEAGRTVDMESSLTQAPPDRGV